MLKNAEVDAKAFFIIIPVLALGMRRLFSSSMCSCDNLEKALFAKFVYCTVQYYDVNKLTLVFNG